MWTWSVLLTPIAICKIIPRSIPEVLFMSLPLPCGRQGWSLGWSFAWPTLGIAVVCMCWINLVLRVEYQKVDNMSPDAIFPCVARSSAAMTFIIEHTLFLNEDKINLPAQYRCLKILENANIFLCRHINPARKAWLNFDLETILLTWIN